MAMVREAVNIVAEGIADAEDVDQVSKAGFGLRLPVYGIFEHQDIVGLDMCLSIVDYVAKDLHNEPHAPDLYRQKVASGDLGVKTGRGFYDWSQIKPFVWTADADLILGKVERFCKRISDDL